MPREATSVRWPRCLIAVDGDNPAPGPHPGRRTRPARNGSRRGSRWFGSSLPSHLTVGAGEAAFAIDRVRAETGVDEAVALLGVSGEGVIVALMDRGIDWESNDFRNDDGTTLRIAWIFDLSDDSGAGDPNNAYGRGTVYTRRQIDEALSGGAPLATRDAVGHGTTTAGIPAGNGRNSADRKYRGIAPNATIIAVKVAGGEGSDEPHCCGPAAYPVAIDFVADKARELAMPVMSSAHTGPTSTASLASGAMKATLANFGPAAASDRPSTGGLAWTCPLPATGSSRRTRQDRTMPPFRTFDSDRRRRHLGDGFFASMYEPAREHERTKRRYVVPFFNPASSMASISRLRVANPNAVAVDVTVEAWDSHGEAAEGVVEFAIDAGAAVLFSSQQLEAGDAEAFTGSLGDGEGRWRFEVSGGGLPLEVMSLLSTGSGHLTNLSR